MVQFKSHAIAALTAMVAFLPSGIKGSTYILSDDRVRSLDATPALGRGYSIMTNSFLSTCLDIDVTTVPSYNYDYTFTDFTQVDNLEDEVAGKISNTFGYYYVKEQIENELSRNVTDGYYKHDYKYHVVSTMRVERFYSSVREEVSSLVANANTLLDKQDYVGFFKACGPNYVRSIRRAQEVTTVFSYFSSSLELAQEFATGLKSSNTFSEESSTMKELDKAKFDPITSSLEIKILGFGLGLDPQGSGSLVLPSLANYTDVMQFAFKSMTQSEGGNSRNIGQVYGIEVSPWVDNVNFQIASKLLEESIEIPLPRSLLATAFATDGSATVFDNSSNRDDFRCKDPNYRIDMYGYCCEREALYDTSDMRYDYSDASTAICRPIRNLDKGMVKNNMNANAEFVARLDAAVQSRFVQLSTLEKCVSAANIIPSKWDDYQLQTQGSVKYDKDFMLNNFTLGMLKAAVDPNSDYGLVNHMGDELDEWMDMYYQPCVAALYGKNVGVSSDVEVAYFMAYPWHTHSECTRLSCLSDSMRWDGSAEGCVASAIAGADGMEPYSTWAYCSKDVESSGTTEACKYDYADLLQYQTDIKANWTSAGIPTDSRIDDIMENYCMPVTTGKSFYVNGPGGP